MSIHDRLTALWDALEARGAIVNRINLAHLSTRAAKTLVAEEERRLRILAEADLPGPPATRTSRP